MIFFIRNLTAFFDISPQENMLHILIISQWQILIAYSMSFLIAAGLVCLFCYYRLKWIRLERKMCFQQKQTEQVKAIVEMKNRFLVNIIQELSAPLSPTMASIEKLQLKQNNGDASEELSTVQFSATRLLQVVNQLLELSKLEADSYSNKPIHQEEIIIRMQVLLNGQEKMQANYREEVQRRQDFSQMKEVDTSFMKNIYTIIETMINDSQLGASKLAEKNSMSLRTLNRKLNAMTGLTAGDVIRQYRLQKSLTFLKAGHNVSEVAYMVGFETPAYFSQCFKDHYGVSPKDYFINARQN